MILLYHDRDLFIWNLSHRLGTLRRDLHELKAENLLAGSVATLLETGYHYNFALGSKQGLIALASGPLSRALQGCSQQPSFSRIARRKARFCPGPQTKPTLSLATA